MPGWPPEKSTTPIFRGLSLQAALPRLLYYTQHNEAGIWKLGDICKALRSGACFHDRGYLGLVWPIQCTLVFCNSALQGVLQNIASVSKRLILQPRSVRAELPLPPSISTRHWTMSLECWEAGWFLPC